MFTPKIMRNSAAALAMLSMSAAPLFANAPVSAIDVGIENLGIADFEAQPFVGQLTRDLKQAIAERVILADNAQSVDIDVEIRNLSLNGLPVGEDAMNFNEMDGVVAIKAAGTPDTVLTYPVQLAAYQADVTAPEGWTVVSADNDDFYTAMVEKFAEETVEWLAQVNTAEVERLKKVRPAASAGN